MKSELRQDDVDRFGGVPEGLRRVVRDAAPPYEKARIAAPASGKCVAKRCRNAWAATGLLILARLRAGRRPARRRRSHVRLAPGPETARCFAALAANRPEGSPRAAATAWRSGPCRLCLPRRGPASARCRSWALRCAASPSSNPRMNSDRCKGHLYRQGKQDGQEEEAKLIGRDEHQQACAQHRADD